MLSRHQCLEAVAALMVVCVPLHALSNVNVLTYHNDNFRTGANLSEVLLTPTNVNTRTFGKLFSYALDGCVHAQPLYVSDLSVAGRGTRNVVFAATEHNTVYGLDADSNAGPAVGMLWQRNLGPSALTPNNDFGLRFGGFQTIVPEVGITGTPVIDLASKTLYVDAFTHEGSSYFHRLHALNITDGTERPFSPVLVKASVPGSGVGGVGGIVRFDPKQQLQRCALTLAGGIVYVAYAGYDDSDPYHGWIIGFNATNLETLPDYVFNTTPNSGITNYGPNAGEGGIWMAGCGLSVDAETNLFFAVGNGIFNAFNKSGGTEYSDSVIRLSTKGRFTVADYFTPYNQEFLAENNLDVGSSGMLLLPDQPGQLARLMVGGSKAAKLYLLNRDKMTSANNHFNADGVTDEVLQTVPLGGAVLSTPAYFAGRIYTAASGDVLASFALSNALLQVDDYQASTRYFPYPGATPSISADGTNNGIVWLVQRSDPAVLLAYEAENLSHELYNSSQAANARGQLAAGVRFAVPTVANGRVYIGGQDNLSVFGLSSNVSPYGAWCGRHFGTNANSLSIAGPQADPDKDGIINVLEYAFGSDPNLPDATPPCTAVISSARFLLQFKRNVLATDLAYEIQKTYASSGPWTTVATYAPASTWLSGTNSATVSESAGTVTSLGQYDNVIFSETAACSIYEECFWRVVVSFVR